MSLPVVMCSKSGSRIINCESEAIHNSEISSDVAYNPYSTDVTKARPE